MDEVTGQQRGYGTNSKTRTYTMSSIMTKNQPTDRFQWNQSRYHLFAPMTLQLEFFFHSLWKRIKYSTIDTVPSSAVLILKTAFADNWSRVRPYHMPKYSPMGMHTQSRNMSVQKKKMDFFLVRSVYLSGGGARKSGSSYVTCVWGKRECGVGDGARLGRALAVVRPAPLTGVESRAPLSSSLAPSTWKPGTGSVSACPAVVGRDLSAAGVNGLSGSVDVCWVAMAR
jgi:hypothetical protein